MRHRSRRRGRFGQGLGGSCAPVRRHILQMSLTAPAHACRSSRCRAGAIPKNPRDRFDGQPEIVRNFVARHPERDIGAIVAVGGTRQLNPPRPGTQCITKLATRSSADFRPSKTTCSCIAQNCAWTRAVNSRERSGDCSRQHGRRRPPLHRPGFRRSIHRWAASNAEYVARADHFHDLTATVRKQLVEHDPAVDELVDAIGAVALAKQWARRASRWLPADSLAFPSPPRRAAGGPESGWRRASGLMAGRST